MLRNHSFLKSAFCSIAISAALASGVGADVPIQLVGRCDTRGFASDVDVSGGRVYVTWSIPGGTRGIDVVDISNSAAPVRVGGCATGGMLDGMAVSGSYAYVASWEAGLQVIDISNPAAPVWVGGCSGFISFDVVVSGGYALLTCGPVWGPIDILNVVDVSTPSAPVWAGGCGIGGCDIGGVAASGAYAYLARWEAGLQVVDISMPAAPVLVGSYDTSGSAYGVAVSDGYVYVAGGESGLVILALDQDQDGIVDPQDRCPDSDSRPTLFIQASDTGVENKMLATGCTMADALAASAAQARNHGAFVSGVTNLTNEWKKAGLISGPQRGAIQSCAGSASIP
jgi:hypothetical protein